MEQKELPWPWPQNKRIKMWSGHEIAHHFLIAASGQEVYKKMLCGFLGISLAAGTGITSSTTTKSVRAFMIRCGVCFSERMQVCRLDTNASVSHRKSSIITEKEGVEA